jgi:CRISPR-associated protein Csm5
MSTTLYLTTHTPVHIGTGAELEAFEYVVHQKRYHRIRLDAVMGQVLDAHPEAADEFATWIDKQVGKLDRERDNQQQARIRQGMTVLEFVRHELGDQQLVRSLQQGLDQGLSQYRMASANISGFRQKVREQLKTATQALYLPGSSLKGAFRTALLYQVIREAPDEKKQRYKRILEDQLREDQQNRRYKDKFFAQGLEQEVFVCGHKEKGKEQIRYQDAKYDLWRLVGFSDSDARLAAEAGVVTNVDLYLMRGEKGKQTPPVEAIAPGQTFTCQVRVDTAFLMQARKLLGSDPKFGKEHWIGLKDKFQRVFGFDFTTVLDAEEIERQVVDRLLTASQNFQKAVLQRERRWADVQIENRTYLPQANALKRFYDGLPPEAFKVGWASGFPATTVFTALADDPVLKPVLQGILEHFKIGKPPRADNWKGVNPAKLPSSRRYAVDAEGNVEAFGWVSASRIPPEPRAVPDGVAEAEEPAAAGPPPSPPAPQGPPPKLKSINKNSKDILAVVLENQSRPLKVRLWVEGYENEVLNLGGVNPTDFPRGTVVKVQVSGMNKKTNRVQDITYQSRSGENLPLP